MTTRERSTDHKKNKAVQGLADKLQQGWTMLGTCCPQCNTPLMREKNGKRIYCVSCELWVVREADLDAQQLEQLAQQQQQQAPRATTSSSSSSSSSSKPPTREKTIQELEAGLASLSDHREFGRITDELRDENDGVKAEEREEEEKEDEEEDYASGPTMSAAQVDSHMRRMNELSSKLGAKMLAGWTLLGDSCPNEECACPLMRARGEPLERMVCVNCGSQVVKQPDGALRIVQPAAKTPAAPAPAPVAASVPAPAEAKTAPRHLRPSSGPRKTRRQRFEDDEDEDDGGEESDDLEKEVALAEGGDVVVSPSSGHIDLQDPYRLDHLPNDFSDPSNLGPSTYSPFGAPAGSGAKKEKEDGDDDASSKIGQMMLAGYALLAAHCPRADCHCPLVRKRDGPMLCVKCGSTVVDAEEYDEKVHGRAENVDDAASAATSKSAVTPVKRMASPGLNQVRQEEQSADKRNRVDAGAATGIINSSSSKSPTFQSSLLVASPLMRPAAPAGELSAPTSSTESSPALSGSKGHSRAWSMELEHGEANVDPRLRAQAQLGGKRGRFNGPRSRAPSLAVQSAQGQVAQVRTSSAALNAAAQMAFGGATSATGKRSGPSSLEQSPLSTPWPTPQVVPSMSLAGRSPTFAPASSSTSKYAPSRHPSISFAPQQFAPAGRGTLIQPQPRSPPMAQTPQVRFAEPAPQAVEVVGEFTMPSAVALPSSASAPSPHLDYASVLHSTHLALVAKLDECRARLASADGPECRDLAATIRDLVSTITALQQAERE